MEILIIVLLYLLGGINSVALVAYISLENGTLEKASFLRKGIEFTIAFVAWPLIILIAVLVAALKFILKP